MYRPIFDPTSHPSYDPAYQYTVEWIVTTLAPPQELQRLFFTDDGDSFLAPGIIWIRDLGYVRREDAIFWLENGFKAYERDFQEVTIGTLHWDIRSEGIESPAARRARLWQDVVRLPLASEYQWNGEEYEKGSKEHYTVYTPGPPISNEEPHESPSAAGTGSRRTRSRR